MVEWKQIRYPANTRVKVLLKGKILDGILQTEYELGSATNEMPIILLDSGQTVEGCACWWIPFNEIEGVPV